MPIKVTDYMVNKLKASLEEADTLGAAIWGGVPNTKDQVALDKRKRALVTDLTQIRSFLTELQGNVEHLQMVDIPKDEE
jgi:hypothetical protein